MSQPGIGKAVDHGLHLVLEVARLAQDISDPEEFLHGVADRLAILVRAERVTFNLYDPGRKILVARPAPDGSEGNSPLGLPCDPAASDLLSQVVFAGRVYRGTLDFGSLEFRRYAHFSEFWAETGTRVLMAPWRAGDERMGAVIAHGLREPEGFTQENAIVLIVAGHAAGLVWQRKRAEQKLAERADQLESLERAKSLFLKLASHELRGPLTVLNGYVSMLADGSLSADRLGGIMPVLQQAIERMNLMVDQFIETTRVAAEVRLQLREVDLRDLLQIVAGRVVGRWQREEDFELCLPDSAVPVEVDVRRIEVAAGNLLDNAFKYSAPGNKVSCDLRARDGLVWLQIRDEGIGMSDEEMADLFTRFGRAVTPRNSHIVGVGLGLYLSRENVRMHGGDVTATSALGEGSTFTLTLPLAPGAKAVHERRRWS